MFLPGTAPPLAPVPSKLYFSAFASLPTFQGGGVFCDPSSSIQRKLLIFSLSSVVSCCEDSSDGVRDFSMGELQLEVPTWWILMSYFMIVLEGLVPFSLPGDGWEHSQGLGME